MCELTAFIHNLLIDTHLRDSSQALRDKSSAVKDGCAMLWAQQQRVLTEFSAHHGADTALTGAPPSRGPSPCLTEWERESGAQCALAPKFPPGVVHWPQHHTATWNQRAQGITTHLKGLEILGEQHRGLPPSFSQVLNPRAPNRFNKNF